MSSTSKGSCQSLRADRGSLVSHLQGGQLGLHLGEVKNGGNDDNLAVEKIGSCFFCFFKGKRCLYELPGKKKSTDVMYIYITVFNYITWFVCVCVLNLLFLSNLTFSWRKNTHLFLHISSHPADADPGLHGAFTLQESLVGFSAQYLGVSGRSLLRRDTLRGRLRCPNILHQHFPVCTNIFQFGWCFWTLRDGVFFESSIQDPERKIQVSIMIYNM